MEFHYEQNSMDVEIDKDPLGGVRSNHLRQIETAEMLRETFVSARRTLASDLTPEVRNRCRNCEQVPNESEVIERNTRGMIFWM